MRLWFFFYEVFNLPFRGAKLSRQLGKTIKVLMFGRRGAFRYGERERLSTVVSHAQELTDIAFYIARLFACFHCLTKGVHKWRFLCKNFAVHHDCFHCRFPF